MMRMDRFQAMTVFVAVADLRGFAPAARKLSLSPSVVTRQVAALEELLGTRLLQRTTRTVALTAAGARYLERARRIVADLAEAEANAQAERTTPSGHFALAAPQVFGRLHVAPLLGRYLEQHPAVTAELVLGDRAVNLIDEGFDAAVRIGALSDSAVVARTVGATRRVLVGSPRYLAHAKSPRRPGALATHRLIHFSGVSPTPEWRFTRRGVEQRVAFTPAFTTNSADVAIAQAERGGGLALVLGYQVQAAVKAGRLQVVLEQYEPPALPIHVLYPSTRLLSAKVRAFVDLVARVGDWQFVDFSSAQRQRSAAGA